MWPPQRVAIGKQPLDEFSRSCCWNGQFRNQLLLHLLTKSLICIAPSLRLQQGAGLDAKNLSDLDERVNQESLLAGLDIGD
jgi:hypothetical protein